MQNNDLSHLVEETEKSLRKTSSAIKRKRRGPGLYGLLLKLLLVVVAVIAIYRTADTLNIDNNLSATAIQTELVSILYQARDSILPVISITGNPPPRLPNASLAAVVNYRVTGSRYTLSIELAGNSASLNAAGDLVVNGETISHE